MSRLTRVDQIYGSFVYGFYKLVNDRHEVLVTRVFSNALKILAYI